MQLQCDFLSCHTLPQINVQLSICTNDKKGRVEMNGPQHPLNRGVDRPISSVVETTMKINLYEIRPLFCCM